MQEWDDIERCVEDNGRIRTRLPPDTIGQHSPRHSTGFLLSVFFRIPR